MKNEDKVIECSVEDFLKGYVIVNDFTQEEIDEYWNKVRSLKGLNDDGRRILQKS